MNRKRFSVEQIVAIVKQAEMGLPVAELIRRVGISEQTFYRWKKQYTGLEVDQVRQFFLTYAGLAVGALAGFANPRFNPR
jgi:putative transposase